MDFDAQQKELDVIYAIYEREVAFYKTGAICKPGCAFCCTHFGNLDVTTLEGRIIQTWVNQQRPDTRTALHNKINKNRKAKSKGKAPTCPFLRTDHTCRIYPIRPFSCRQLYSVRECEGRGPTIHRQARDASRQAIAKLQQLDATGYSGHISYILYLLDQKNFRKVYFTGAFDPSTLKAFGKRYGIVINRKALSKLVNQ
jgi:Fe-S-cluster containining protein